MPNGCGSKISSHCQLLEEKNTLFPLLAGGEEEGMVKGCDFGLKIKRELRRFVINAIRAEFFISCPESLFFTNPGPVNRSKYILFHLFFIPVEKMSQYLPTSLCFFWDQLPTSITGRPSSSTYCIGLNLELTTNYLILNNGKIAIICVSESNRSIIMLNRTYSAGPAKRRGKSRPCGEKHRFALISLFTFFIQERK